MSGPSLDLEKPNLIGGLDKLVTNFAISAIAVVPTFLTCIVKPWRLRALIDQDLPDGRRGLLLGPGAYFPLSLMVAFIVAALLATPETINTNSAFIGPGLAVSVQSAASEGDVWKIIATIMPIYGLTIVLGLLGLCLKSWAGESWTLRVSLRAAFYVAATLISWAILVTAIVDLIRISTVNFDVQSIYMFVVVPTASAVLWMYFWFFQNNGTVSYLRSGALCAAMFGLIVAMIVVMEILIRL